MMVLIRYQFIHHMQVVLNMWMVLVFFNCIKRKTHKETVKNAVALKIEYTFV